jgi:hypothetical protein
MDQTANETTTAGNETAQADEAAGQRKSAENEEDAEFVDYNFKKLIKKSKRKFFLDLINSRYLTLFKEKNANKGNCRSQLE